MNLLSGLRAITLCMAMLVFAHTDHAQELVVDPISSEIHFTLGDVLHTVNGTFKVMEGHLQIKPERQEITGTIQVSAASGESGSNARDQRMKDSELRVNEYPNVIFQPRKYEGTLAPSGKSYITVTGTMTLLGSAHDISVPMVIDAVGPRYRASGTFDVPYVAWGLKDPSTFILRVGKDVKIEVLLSATRKQ